MKARVKLTGQIVDVVVKEIPQYGFLGECAEPIEYRITRFYDGENYYRYDELDFEVETFIYWEKLEHQFAGMAMQGILANQALMQGYSELAKAPITSGFLNEYVIAKSVNIAHELIEKLKEERHDY